MTGLLPEPTTLPLRVLVADDMPLNLRAAAELLKALSHGGALVADE